MPEYWTLVWVILLVILCCHLNFVVNCQVSGTSTADHIQYFPVSVTSKMGPKRTDLRSHSPAGGAGFASDSLSNNDKIVEMLIQIQETINTGNNIHQETLNTLLTKVDTLDDEHKRLSEEISGESGLKYQVSELQEQCGIQEDRMRKLEVENTKLKSELTVLKNIIIHTDHRVSHNENQITDLKVRSMNANILIHGVKENSSENLKADISELFSTDLGIPNVKFSSIHRMGKLLTAEEKKKQGQNNAQGPKVNKPRIIVARLLNSDDKSNIIAKANELDISFRVTSQYPEEVRDTKTRLYHVKDEYTDKKVECDIKGSKLVFKKSGSVFREKVTLPPPEILMTATDPNVKEKLDQIQVHEGDHFNDKGNHIVSYSATVNSYKDVSNFSIKVLASEGALPANSNVLVYRFLDANGAPHEGWENDREFGAGLNILKSAKEQQYENFAVILSRKLGEHLGFKRHQVFRDNALSAIVQTQ